MAKLQGNTPHEWHIIGDVLVTFTVEGAIKDDLWSRYLETLSKGNYRINLAFSSNAALTALQRKAASDALKARNVQAIVMTDSALTRGIVTALTWLGTNIRAYSYSELDEAVRVLNVNADVAQEITTLAQEFMRAHSLK